MFIPIFIHTGSSHRTRPSILDEFIDEVLFSWKFWAIAGPIAIIGSWLINQTLYWWVSGEWYWLPYFLRN